MSKFNLQGASITAKEIHIGDKYYYSSPQDFFDNNNQQPFTKTEQELIDIIFENTSSKEERQDILDSLKAIRDESRSESEKKKSFLIFRPLIEKLKSKGMQLAIGLLKKFAEENINSINLDKIGI